MRKKRFVPVSLRYSPAMYVETGADEMFPFMAMRSFFAPFAANSAVVFTPLSSVMPAPDEPLAEREKKPVKCEGENAEAAIRGICPRTIYIFNRSRKERERGKMTSEKQKRVDALIAESYSADSKVRMRVVAEISALGNDPGAIFALLELSGDKDVDVKGKAQEALERLRSTEKTDMLSIEKLFLQSESEHVETENDVKVKLFPSIEKMFTAKKTKQRMMSTLEKYFSKRKKHNEELVAVSREEGQTRIGEHFEVMRRVEKIGEYISAKDKEGLAEPAKEEGEIESIGSYEEGKEEAKREADSKEGESAPSVCTKERREIAETAEEDASLVSGEEEEKSVVSGDPFFEEIYGRAYSLASREGATDKMLSDEEKNVAKELSHKVEMAFRLAKLQCRGMGVQRLASLKIGMKKIRLPEVTVGEVEKIEIRKGKKSTDALKITLLDQTGKFPLCLPQGRGRGIAVGDRVAVQGAYVDGIGDTGEAALFVAPKGKITLNK